MSLVADALSRDPVAAAAALPAGRYAVGVSGGADSVALLRLLRARNDCHGVVVHLDHELRGDDSAADARFVADLAGEMGWPAVIEKRSAIAAGGEAEVAVRTDPANAHAAYRAARHRLFARVAAGHGVDAVLLAHHADDQAETVLLKLLRGGGIESLAGMRPATAIGPLRVVRPLLNVPAAVLRDYLRAIGQPWREDTSNADPRYRRTLVRQFLSRHPGLTGPLCDVARVARAYADAVERLAPLLPEVFETDVLAALPPPLARRAARRWLAAHGGRADDLSRSVCDRLLRQAAGVGPARQHYPGGTLVQRRNGRIAAVVGANNLQQRPAAA
ncbi:MAG TPA: tRNA lysidine(34) synthetase TilS, partial [Tepidisphaeraceae bacterium]